MGRLSKVIGAVVILVVVAGVGVYWFVLRDDAPAKVDVACGATDSGAGPAADLTGAWKVAPSATQGDALLRDAAPGSWAGYRIEEDLRAVHVTAVGRTPDITGAVTVEGTTVRTAEFTVDMTTIESNEGLRDNRMKSDGLQTEQFPKAAFALSSPIDIGTAAGCREATATGRLNLHGVERPVSLQLKIVPSADGFDVTGTTRITLADYAMSPPKLGFVTVDPAGDLEVALRLVR